MSMTHEDKHAEMTGQLWMDGSDERTVERSAREEMEVDEPHKHEDITEFATTSEACSSRGPVPNSATRLSAA